MVSPGVFYVNYSSGPLGDSGVIADGPNWHLWECPFEGISQMVKSEQLWG